MRRLMSCLGDPSRYQLVSQLVRGERCVSDLARQVGLSQSCTTRHLQALQREQIVRRERAGKRVLFRLCLDEPQVGDLLAWAMAARAGKQGSRRTARPVGPRDGSTPEPPAPAVGHGRAREPAAGHSRAGKPEDGHDRTGESEDGHDRGGEPAAGPARPFVPAAYHDRLIRPVADPSPAPPPPRPPRQDLEDYLL